MGPQVNQFTNTLIDCSMGRQVDQWTNTWIDCLMGQPVNQFTNALIDCLMGRHVNQFTNNCRSRRPVRVRFKNRPKGGWRFLPISGR